MSSARYLLFDDHYTKACQAGSQEQSLIAYRVVIIEQDKKTASAPSDCCPRGIHRFIALHKLWHHRDEVQELGAQSLCWQGHSESAGIIALARLQSARRFITKCAQVRSARAIPHRHSSQISTVLAGLQ